MNLDYRTADGKSHTHAAGFGGEKGVEQPARILGGDHLIVIGIVIGVADAAATQAGLPSISFESSFAQRGGLISYGPDFPAMARLGAHYVDRILKGAKPAELPIEQHTKFLLLINLKTAKSLGIEIPTTLLARADEVIE